MTLQEIIDQLRSCGYECEAGPLENNVAFQELERLVSRQAAKNKLSISFQSIKGIDLKPLTTYPDERGFFREIIRAGDEFFSEGFGQWSMSKMNQGTIKAWHIHQKQTDWWYCPVGTIRAVLCDQRPDSSSFGLINEFLLGEDSDPVVLKIPPGVAHGLKVIQGPAMLFYITSREYDPADEGRIPYDALGYDWLKGPEIK